MDEYGHGSWGHRYLGMRMGRDNQFLACFSAGIKGERWQCRLQFLGAFVKPL